MMAEADRFPLHALCLPQASPCPSDQLLFGAIAAHYAIRQAERCGSAAKVPLSTGRACDDMIGPDPVEIKIVFSDIVELLPLLVVFEDADGHISQEPA